MKAALCLLADILRLIFAGWLAEAGELLRSLNKPNRKEPR
jgi:hypothetical protein